MTEINRAHCKKQTNTFCFSHREGTKLRLCSGSFVTGWIIVSLVKKSTHGWKNTNHF